jgi:hypothetical protein
MAPDMSVHPVCIWMQHVLTTSQPKARAGSYFFTEVRAGMATFFAMAYIIAVNCMCCGSVLLSTLTCTPSIDYFEHGWNLCLPC